ncbi:hypothetical protein NC653_029363 [Populus alba x Populus x berolinensis]|uniref:Uncharacterized protein n=1 Tax=Populus alba x Populus x berolinensis TaxID=444605 RepID=A0AAD6M1V2_9ROSI|nr:hypothetical protein NC653_029363 [Populus alba x Populus x berolinensis]
MAVRSLLALMVLLFCLAEVSSDPKMDTEIPRVFQARLGPCCASCCERWKQEAPARHRYCDGFETAIVEGYARRDAVFTQGLICATGPVAPAV